MIKDRSSQPSSFGDNFSLPRAKILRGRKNFRRLFERDALIVRNKCISLRYLIVDETRFGCLMGFITPKKLGKANKRNRMRRLLKEAYRLHQSLLLTPLQAAQQTFHGALVAHKIGLSFDEVEREVVALLKKVSEQVSHNSPRQ